MFQTSFDELKQGFRQIHAELNELKEIVATRRSKSAWWEFKCRLAALRFEAALIRYSDACRKAGFNPSQPRMPAGSRDGGQWMSDGSDSSRGGGQTSRVRFDGGSDKSPVMSDATPDVVAPGAQYAQTQIGIKPEALTGDARIDTATIKLTTTLAEVMDVIEYVPGLTPQEYGRMVHEKFADTVRVLDLPGIAYEDVETTFGGAYYGARGSIRTDVVLRDDTNKVIAIYDVKTGDATIGAARAAELRAKTGAGPSVPIIELQAIHGVTRKGISCARIACRLLLVGRLGS